MRIFDEGNWTNNKCPVCKTSMNGKVVLIPIVGTQEGHNSKAKQVHLGCLNLWIDDECIIQVLK